LKTKASRNNHMISKLEFVAFSNFSGVGLDGEDLMCFQSENGVFKSLRLSVDEASVLSML